MYDVFSDLSLFDVYICAHVKTLGLQVIGSSTLSYLQLCESLFFVIARQCVR
jgi:hypothetical protein